ncbi:Adenylate kinase 7 [Gaertneriomyces sp. JEL0708]|nr:Adenylate kinase 7 [Gaertneriomyces sp. JEL0708]
MRVFVSNVDNDLGWNVSRLLSKTIVGSRREEEAEEEEPDEHERSQPKSVVKAPYTIIGTLTARPHEQEGKDHAEEDYRARMVESGDRGRDAIHRDAIEKLALRGKVPSWVAETVQVNDREQLKDVLLSCDVIVYDMVACLDEAAWAIQMLSEQADSFAESSKTFIGISTVMTWARTKVDPDDPDAFLAEDEYRRRKPHPNFKAHLAVEKDIIKFGKKNALKTYVIAAGLQYHPGTNIFHHFFKTAWHNQPLTCYGDGSNALPTISLDDLTNIIVETIETTPTTRYLLAVDDSKQTLMEIIKAISASLGTGKVKKASKESALLNKELSQADYDMLLVNLRLEPGHVKNMSFEWRFEAGLVENIPQVIQEYKYARGLTPLRIVLHGPPASGKTFFASRIAQHYDIHLIQLSNVIEEAVARLERRVAGNLTPEEEEDDVEVDKELLDELKEAMHTNGRYPDEHVVTFVRDKLRSMPCRNQGYVLDGYPNTMNEAKDLFGASDDDEAKDDPTAPKVDEVLGPDFVISLDIPDNTIKERIMKLPETAVAGTNNTEEALTHRLEEFRAANTDENTVLNFFDELEIHPLIVSVWANDTSTVMEIITKHIGKPHNYGPTPEQITEKRRLLEEAKAREAAAAEEERQRREKEEAERQSKAATEWGARLEEVRKQEQEVLEAQSVPLRNYLMKYVMPTLTSGLIEVCKVRPEDPIDYLAEFLFKHNPGNQ